jgi:hypothetical protein
MQRMEWASLDLPELIETGQIRDSGTLIALLYLEAYELRARRR